VNSFAAGGGTCPLTPHYSTIRLFVLSSALVESVGRYSDQYLASSWRGIGVRAQRTHHGAASGYLVTFSFSCWCFEFLFPPWPTLAIFFWLLGVFGVSGGGVIGPIGHVPLRPRGPGASCYLLIRASTSTSRYLVFTRFRRTPRSRQPFGDPCSWESQRWTPFSRFEQGVAWCRCMTSDLTIFSLR
jgi:hypothetical protein